MTHPQQPQVRRCHDAVFGEPTRASRRRGMYAHDTQATLHLVVATVQVNLLQISSLTRTVLVLADKTHSHTNDHTVTHPSELHYTYFSTGKTRKRDTGRWEQRGNKSLINLYASRLPS